MVLPNRSFLDGGDGVSGYGWPTLTKATKRSYALLIFSFVKLTGSIV